MFFRLILLLPVFLLSINVVKAGGHLPHEIAPAAKSGQSIIIYRMPCSAKGQADALSTLSVMADHEHQIAQWNIRRFK